ncbi:ATP-binding protein [Streptomyces sp. NPDC094468]|uniref:ATP-binding protein n=1 Tax=Streptomyces sp. NPDC094468 TaxID=3366066 RepID=UPI00382EF5EA
MVTSELVTNAVMHARGSTVTVTVYLSARHLWVVVDDEGSPRMEIKAHAADADALGGRGLQLIEAIAARWKASPSSTGSRVWAALDIPPYGSGHNAHDTATHPHDEDTDVPRGHS